MSAVAQPPPRGRPRRSEPAWNNTRSTREKLHRRLHVGPLHVPFSDGGEPCGASLVVLFKEEGTDETQNTHAPDRGSCLRPRGCVPDQPAGGPEGGHGRSPSCQGPA